MTHSVCVFMHRMCAAGLQIKVVPKEKDSTVRRCYVILSEMSNSRQAAIKVFGHSTLPGVLKNTVAVPRESKGHILHGYGTGCSRCIAVMWNLPLRQRKSFMHPPQRHL